MADPTGTRQRPRTRAGAQLYGLLPAVYRDRDNASPEDTGDLAKFLDAAGLLLDQIRATLDQRLADAFPDNPPQGEACQSWLLPYFAQSLDVRLVSPEADGQRDEVAYAVRWRQRKGTLAVVEQIAQAVSQTEVEIQEGWRRVAMTARIGTPVLPAVAFGEPDVAPRTPAGFAAQPGLPAVTVDMRQTSGAMRIDDRSHPMARISRFGDQTVVWRQAHPRGAPCRPNSYQDVSLRTPDMRTASWREGHVHPRRILLYVPPWHGFFDPDWADRAVGDVRLSDLLPPDQPPVLEDVIVDGTLTVDVDDAVLRRCAVRELVVARAAAEETRVITAEDCLFQRVRVKHGTAQLVYCTVLEIAAFERVNASDCLFAGRLIIVGSDRQSCIRYSRIPPDAPLGKLRLYAGSGETNTRDLPVFNQTPVCESRDDRRVPGWEPSRFGQSGCGVLHPATPASIARGAEDGGEMGAYHHRHHRLREDAVLEKLHDYLPVGLEAVVIPDAHLHQIPPGETIIVDEDGS